MLRLGDEDVGPNGRSIVERVSELIDERDQLSKELVRMERRLERARMRAARRKGHGEKYQMLRSPSSASSSSESISSTEDPPNEAVRQRSSASSPSPFTPPNHGHSSNSVVSPDLSREVLGESHAHDGDDVPRDSVQTVGSSNNVGDKDESPDKVRQNESTEYTL